MSRLNLLDPDVLANPYPFLAELQKSSPVCQVEPGGAWAVTRYEDVLAVFKDHKRFSSEGLAILAEPPYLGSNPLSRSMVTAEPARHGKLRALVSRAFGPTGMARLETLVRKLAEDLAAEVVRRREVDIVAEFAVALPRAVIGHLLGVDPAVYPKLRRWANAMSTVTAATTPELQEEVRSALGEMRRYVDEVLESRRAELREDMVSDLIRAEVEGQRLSQEDLVSFMFLLLSAGMETTTNLLGSSVALLAQHPAELKKAREDRTHIPTFIEEVLRYETPVRMNYRLTTTEVELGGTPLPPGSFVFLMMGPANRDPRVFSEPDRFLPGREKQNQHLAFGYGIHFCLGAQLARMEARFGLEALLSRARDITLKQPEVEWMRSIAVRGPAALPVEVTPL